MSKTMSFSEKIVSSLSRENMLQTVQAFSTLHRYSGKKQGEESVDYIVKKLQEYGIAYERECYEGYFSIPVSASLTITSPYGKAYDACGCVFSGDAHDLAAEVYYDYRSEWKGQRLSEEEEAQRDREFKGKIVLSREGASTFADRLYKAGAVGMVHIWPVHDNMLHHSNIDPIWGTPDTRDHDRMTYLPAVTFRASDADEIIEACKKGKVYGSLNITMDTAVAKSTMPVATIPGKTNKYVLISAHYDSWYEGITDNAAADAIILEIARVFKENQSKLLRGVKICWWSGHSDGRYAGSTWWCDNHWFDLRKNCVAHINLDICGCMNTGKILMRTSLMEGFDYGADKIQRITGLRPARYIPMVKGADQSFWGVNVPIILMAKNEPLPGNENLWGEYYGAGGGPWWHSVSDTLDKLDVDAMVRDATLNAEFAADLTTMDVLPVKISGFLEEMKKELNLINEDLVAEDFNIKPVIDRVTELEDPVKKLEAAIAKTKGAAADDIVKDVAGELVRIFYTTVDPYYFEPATPIAFGGKSTALRGLRTAAGITRENTCATNHLFIKTTFVRQRNRLIGEMNNISQKIELYLGKNRESGHEG